MATRVKARSDLYADDLYAWSKVQADLLRAGRFAELDLTHLIEEVEDVGGAMKRAVRNRTRTILEHLLKLEHSPAQEPHPDWRATIRSRRIKLRDALTPTLRRELQQELPALYADACGLAGDWLPA
jgi:predicted Zn-dependent protease